MSDALTVDDAARRVVVRLSDGRTARLVAVPARSQRRSKGARARVVLASGAFLSVPVDELTRVSEPVTFGSGRRPSHSLCLLPRIRG